MTTTDPTAHTTARASDMLDRMIAWEDGDLPPDDERALFEDLTESGLIYQLQGCYGRRAQALGLI